MTHTPVSYQAKLSHQIWLLLYSTVIMLLSPLVFMGMAVSKSKAVSRHPNFPLERFGRVKPANEKGGYLFHCVSVGEVVAASCVIKAIMQQQPNLPITITTTTKTGSARVQELFGDKVNHCYLPFDLPFAMSQFLERISPSLVLITEVELWPNLINQCYQKGIPAMVINARMTERSAHRYSKVSGLFKPMLEKLSCICAQGERDYQHYQTLLPNDSRLVLTNNIKFDQAGQLTAMPAEIMGLVNGQRPILVGGSTHDPEELTLLDALKSLLKQVPDLLLVLVPRHPERFKIVEKMLSESGLRFQTSSTADTVHQESQVLLVDQMGKLNQFYSVANIAFVGGSIADRGGHNALEPAAFSLPIMMGPHIYNNPTICEYLLEHGAMERVHTAQDITTICSKWLQDPTLAKQAGSAGLQVLQSNQGAVDKTLQQIKRIFSLG